MVDKYYMSMDCPFCMCANKHVHYDSDCGHNQHTCEWCERQFLVVLQFKALRMEDVTYPRCYTWERLAQ